MKSMQAIAAYQRRGKQCAVGDGEVVGNINDNNITEASGLAYSRRSEEVDLCCCQWRIFTF